MTQGFCVLAFLPLSESAGALVLSLFFAASRSSSVGSRRISASRAESGDQAKSSTPCGVSVSFCASPPRRFNSQTCVLPSSREERNASHLPSGLQRGWLELAPSAVRGIASPPEVEIIQMRDSLLSSSLFGELTV